MKLAGVYRAPLVDQGEFAEDDLALYAITLSTFEHANYIRGKMGLSHLSSADPADVGRHKPRRRRHKIIG